jgi:16S rRNA (guanine527-N7)-methyltransferase
VFHVKHGPCVVLFHVKHHRMDWLVQPEDQLRQFAAAVRSSPHNLVSRAAREELELRHVPESVAFAKFLPTTVRTVVDIGSGGGFPGMVIAIVRPELTVHLVESVGKKARFLREIADELQVNVTVHYSRIERVLRTKDFPRAEAVTARAVASLRDLAVMVAPMLDPGACLYAIKGARWAEELAEAKETLEHVKLRVLAVPEEGYEPQAGELPRVITLQKCEM